MDHIEEEIRDIMFYICNLATLLELNMETILEKNIKKLAKRYPKGFKSEKSINRFVFSFKHRLWSCRDKVVNNSLILWNKEI